MNPTSPSHVAGKVPSATARREAAVWIARMHSPERGAAVEAGLRRWLQESRDNRDAFERATELWDVAARVPEDAVPRVMRWKRHPLAFRGRQARLVIVCAVALAAVAAFWLTRNPAIATGIGEQRVVTLPDGTRVTLNTNTRLVARYEDNLRRVDLQSGEAFFDVTADTKRPFVVFAGQRQVRVIGTSFLIRHEPTQTAVTLIEGKISIADESDGDSSTSATRRPASAPPGAVTLRAGQRLVFVSEHEPVLDRPPLEKVTAWQRGLVALDHTPLADAILEMNRYNAMQLVVEGPDVQRLLISGVFRAGDSLSFAQAVARTYHLSVEESPDRIVIAEGPQKTF